jgi:hypothetical protein
MKSQKQNLKISFLGIAEKDFARLTPWETMRRDMSVASGSRRESERELTIWKSPSSNKATFI